MALIGSIVIGMQVRTQQLSKGLKTASTSLRRFESAATSTFSGVGKLVAGIATGLVVFEGAKIFGKAITSASDLNEELNKSKVAFGDASSIIENHAASMHRAFGVPKKDFIAASSGIGLIGKAAGYAAPEAADLGVKITELAADMSSFYNTDFKETLESLQSGLVGMARPLRPYGVLLSEARVDNYLLAHGIKKVNGEYTDGQKIQARTALIFRDTTDAQGDLARTADGTANRMREAWGRAGEFLREIGTKIEPFANRLLGSFNSIFARLSNWFESNQQTIDEWAVSIARFIGDSFATASQFVANFQSQFSLMLSNNQENASSVFDWLKSAWNTVSEYIGTILRNWDQIFQGTMVRVGHYLTNVGETIQWLGSVSSAFLDWVGTNWKSIFRDIFDFTVTACTNYTKNIVSILSELINWIKSGFSQPFSIKLTPLMDGFEAKTKAFEAPKLNLSSVDQDALDKISKTIEDREKKAIEDSAARKKAFEKILTPGSIPTAKGVLKKEIEKEAEKEKAEKEKAEKKPEKTLGEALLAGSEKARSTILEHRLGRSPKEAEKIAKNQLQVQKQIAKNTKPSSVPPIELIQMAF